MCTCFNWQLVHPYRNKCRYFTAWLYKLQKMGKWMDVKVWVEYAMTTLRTPWSWQKYCLNHCARTCCSLRNVTRCRFTNWWIRCERSGRNVHFLSINLISFHRSRGIVLVKLRVFRSWPNPHCHRQRHWQSVSSLVRCLWLARLVLVWKAPPGDVTARSE